MLWNSETFSQFGFMVAWWGSFAGFLFGLGLIADSWGALGWGLVGYWLG